MQKLKKATGFILATVGLGLLCLDGGIELLPIQLGAIAMLGTLVFAFRKDIQNG